MTDAVIGPMCEKCGKHRGIIIPFLEKRKVGQGFEMVKVYYCLLHFVEVMDKYADLFPEDAQDFQDMNDKDEDDDEEDDEDDKNGFGYIHQIVCDAFQCKFNLNGRCTKRGKIKFEIYDVIEGMPAFYCDEYDDGKSSKTKKLRPNI